MTPEEIAGRLRSPDDGEAMADASFKLAVYLYQNGNPERANALWDQAQKLRPESRNYHRQDWSFLSTEEASQNWLKKFEALDGEPYYAPLVLDLKQAYSRTTRSI